MTTFVQQLVDGIGRGSTYALLALGISLIFGVMHLVNFAHAELITVGAYVAYFLSTRGLGWWVLTPAIVIGAVVASVASERVAFRWVRNASPFTLLLTSFAIEQLSHALWAVLVSPTKQSFAGPDGVFDTVDLAGIRLEVMDLVTIAVTAVVLAGTAGAVAGLLIEDWAEIGAGLGGGLAGAVAAAVVVAGALRRGGTRGGLALIVTVAAAGLAALAFVPFVGYIQAIALPGLAARLRRTQGERYAGLRSLAKD